MYQSSETNFMPTQITSAGITFNDTTSLTSANIGTSQLINGSVTASKLGTNEQKQIAKAWVNFNGTTSPGTIRSSYNVSSVTKNGTGDYTVNFATAMADANYSVVKSDNYRNVGEFGNVTSSSFSCIVRGNATETLIDTTIVSCIVFGN